MTKLYTFQNNSKGQHTHLPQVSPCSPQKGLMGIPQVCGFTVMLCRCSTALPALQYPHSGVRPSRLRHNRGTAPPCHKGCPHLAAGAAFLPHHPPPSTPMTLCRSSSAHRNQQETNHFPDPDLAAFPGTGVPEQAQKRSQDDASGKGGGGGGWD